MVYPKTFEELILIKLQYSKRDMQLSACSGETGISNSAEIILKSKGLEKSCVLWATGIGVDQSTETDEFVYTILAQTTSMLIISICDTINQW